MRQAFLVEQPRHSALRALNYEPVVEKLSRAGQGRKVTRLRNLVADLGSGYATVFSRLDCAAAHGVELLSQTDMFAAEPQGRIIRRDSMQHPERHEVKKWHVLIAGAGTLAPTELYGRAIIADGRLAGKYVGQDSLVIEFSEPESDISLFAYAYLASHTGFKALRASSYGTKILRIRRDVIADLPVPLPDDGSLARVAELVRRCVEQREIYLRELQAARRVLEELPEMREAHSMCAERKRRCVVWGGSLPTLNAWNYASTGGALDYLLHRWSARLHDVVPKESIFRGGRYQRIPCAPPHGIDFCSQRDVFSIRPVPRRICMPNVDRSWVFIPAFSLIVGGQGTLGEGELFGQVAFATPDLAQSGISEHLLRIQPPIREHAAVCYAFLSTILGRRLLRSTGVGTKLLSLREDMVLALPYPEIESKTARRIVRHLGEAMKARSAASAAESEAIRIIEEEVLPAWLA